MDNSNKNEPSTPDLISIAEREVLLRRQSGFESLSVNEGATLVGLMQEVQMQTGERIVVEGEVIDAVYIIASGTAEVTKGVDLDGKQGVTFLGLLNEGAGIGLKGAQFFSQTGLRTATVTATSPCMLLQLKISDFNQFLTKHPHILQNLQRDTTMMLRMRFIKEAAPFAHLSNEEISGLASNVKEVTMSPGAVIFSQGDVADNCYLLCEGQVEISKRAKDGIEKTIATLEPYSLFGEAALLNFAQRSATVRTLTQSKLLILDKDILLELTAREKEVPGTLMTMLQSHCRPARLANILHQRRTTSDAQEITTLKNTKSNQYLQLSNEGWFIWTKLDGKSTLEEITALFSKQFDRFDPQGVIQIIQKMVDSGFAAIDISEVSADGNVVKVEKQKTLIARLWQNTYIFKSADQKMNSLYKNIGFLLVSPPTVIIATLIIVAGIILFNQNLISTVIMLKDVTSIGWLLVGVIFFSMVCQLTGTLLKALTIKKLGHEVPYLGIIWHLIFPEGFVDTSDLWLASRWIKIWVIAAGLITDLFIASVLAIFAYYLRSTAIALFLWLSSLFIYLKTLRNLSPMHNSESYNLLAYLFDKSQLRELAVQWLTNFEKSSLQKNHHYPEKMFWLYTCFYFALVLFVITWILDKVVAVAIYFPSFRFIILAILALGLIVELALEIRQGKENNASQIL